MEREVREHNGIKYIQTEPGQDSWVEMREHNGQRYMQTTRGEDSWVPVPDTPATPSQGQGGEEKSEYSVIDRFNHIAGNLAAIPTLGLNRQIESIYRAAIDPDKDYEEAAEEVYGRKAELDKEMPKRSFAAELVGGALPVVGGLGKGASLLKATLQNMLAGGVTEFNEGNVFRDPEDSLVDAARGAAWGAGGTVAANAAGVAGKRLAEATGVDTLLKDTLNKFARGTSHAGAATPRAGADVPSGGQLAKEQAAKRLEGKGFRIERSAKEVDPAQAELYEKVELGLGRNIDSRSSLNRNKRANQDKLNDAAAEHLGVRKSDMTPKGIQDEIDRRFDRFTKSGGALKPKVKYDHRNQQWKIDDPLIRRLRKVSERYKTGMDPRRPGQAVGDKKAIDNQVNEIQKSLLNGEITPQAFAERYRLLKGEVTNARTGTPPLGPDHPKVKALNEILDIMEDLAQRKNSGFDPKALAAFKDARRFFGKAQEILPTLESPRGIGLDPNDIDLDAIQWSNRASQNTSLDNILDDLSLLPDRGKKMFKRADDTATNQVSYKNVLDKVLAKVTDPYTKSRYDWQELDELLGKYKGRKGTGRAVPQILGADTARPLGLLFSEEDESVN